MTTEAYQEELAELQARAVEDTEATKALLKEIAVMSGTLKALQGTLERERVLRSKLEARIASLEKEAAAKARGEESDVLRW